MSFFKRISYWFSLKDLITKINVEFEYITQAGKAIYSDTKTFVLKTPILFDGSDGYGYFWKGEREISSGLQIKHYLNKLAEKLLLEARNNPKIVDLSNGKVIQGKYIVKCEWEINIRKEYIKKITYKDYKEGLTPNLDYNTEIKNAIIGKEE